MKTYKEQVADLLATRKETHDRMKAVMQKSLDENRSMDSAEAEEFDNLKAEVGTLDSNLKRLRELERMEEEDLATAEDVDEVRKQAARPAGARVQTVHVAQKEKLDPGIAMARYVIALVKARFNPQAAFALAKQHYPRTEAVVQALKAQAEGVSFEDLLRVKTAVAAGTTTDSTWAAPLVYAQNFMGDFLEYLRPRTLIGQAQFSPIPFNVRILSQTSGGTGYWVGQGKPKPLTKFDFAGVTTPFAKVAAIAVISQELARFSDPSAEGLVRDGLADAVISRIDSDLFDPDIAAVANVSPAGLLNGVAPVAGPAKTGVDAEDVRCALLNLWAPWDSTNLGARPAYYTTPAVARNLSFMRGPLGEPAFPGMTPQGGTLMGVPVRVSQYLANNGGSGGAPLILVDEREIWLSDDNVVTVDASDQVSLQMDDAPTNASAPVSGTSLVSMWQTNSIALRAERFIYWQPRRSGAVQWIDGFPVACG